MLYPTDNEQDLLQRCRHGDSQAQYRLYNLYVTAMYNTAIRMLAHAPEAEDVLQVSFTKVFQQLHTFRNESSLGAWIKRIVVNTALEYLRTRRKLTFLALENGQDIADEPTEEVYDWDAAMLHHAIKKLPDGCRVVFTLYALENLPHKSIAQTLNISESTSKTQYMRAKKLLKEHLMAMKKMDTAQEDGVV